MTDPYLPLIERILAAGAEYDRQRYGEQRSTLTILRRGKWATASFAWTTKDGVFCRGVDAQRALESLLAELLLRVDQSAGAK